MVVPPVFACKIPLQHIGDPLADGLTGGAVLAQGVEGKPKVLVRLS
jgi:hypothetical protein